MDGDSPASALTGPNVRHVSSGMTPMSSGGFNSEGDSYKSDWADSLKSSEIDNDDDDQDLSGFFRADSRPAAGEEEGTGEVEDVDGGGWEGDDDLDLGDLDGADMDPPPTGPQIQPEFEAVNQEPAPNDNGPPLGAEQPQDPAAQLDQAEAEQLVPPPAVGEAAPAPLTPPLLPTVASSSTISTPQPPPTFSAQHPQGMAPSTRPHGGFTVSAANVPVPMATMPPAAPSGSPLSGPPQLKLAAGAAAGAVPGEDESEGTKPEGEGEGDKPSLPPPPGLGFQVSVQTIDGAPTEADAVPVLPPASNALAGDRADPVGPEESSVVSPSQSPVPDKMKKGKASKKKKPKAAATTGVEADEPAADAPKKKKLVKKKNKGADSASNLEDGADEQSAPNEFAEKAKDLMPQPENCSQSKDASAVAEEDYPLALDPSPAAAPPTFKTAPVSGGFKAAGAPAFGGEDVGNEFDTLGDTADAQPLGPPPAAPPTFKTAPVSGGFKAAGAPAFGGEDVGNEFDTLGDAADAQPLGPPPAAPPTFKKAPVSGGFKAAGAPAFGGEAEESEFDTWGDTDSTPASSNVEKHMSSSIASDAAKADESGGRIVDEISRPHSEASAAIPQTQPPTSAGGFKVASSGLFGATSEVDENDAFATMGSTGPPPPKAAMAPKPPASGGFKVVSKNPFGTGADPAESDFGAFDVPPPPPPAAAMPAPPSSVGGFKVAAKSLFGGGADDGDDFFGSLGRGPANPPASRAQAYQQPSDQSFPRPAAPTVPWNSATTEDGSDFFDDPPPPPAATPADAGPPPPAAAYGHNYGGPTYTSGQEQQHMYQAAGAGGYQNVGNLQQQGGYWAGQHQPAGDQPQPYSQYQQYGSSGYAPSPADGSNGFQVQPSQDYSGYAYSQQAQQHYAPAGQYSTGGAAAYIPEQPVNQSGGPHLFVPGAPPPQHAQPPQSFSSHGSASLTPQGSGVLVPGAPPPQPPRSSNPQGSSNLAPQISGGFHQTQPDYGTYGNQNQFSDIYSRPDQQPYGHQIPAQTASGIPPAPQDDGASFFEDLGGDDQPAAEAVQPAMETQLKQPHQFQQFMHAEVQQQEAAETPKPPAPVPPETVSEPKSQTPYQFQQFGPSEPEIAAVAEKTAPQQEVTTAAAEPPKPQEPYQFQQFGSSIAQDTLQNDTHLTGQETHSEAMPLPPQQQPYVFQQFGGGEAASSTIPSFQEAAPADPTQVPFGTAETTTGQQHQNQVAEQPAFVPPAQNFANQQQYQFQPPGSDVHLGAPDSGQQQHTFVPPTYPSEETIDLSQNPHQFMPHAPAPNGQITQPQQPSVFVPQPTAAYSEAAQDQHQFQPFVPQAPAVQQQQANQPLQQAPAMMMPAGMKTGDLTSNPPKTAGEALKAPLGRPPCPVFCFAFGGRIAVMQPQVDPRSGGAYGSGFGSSTQPQWWDTRYVNNTIKFQTVQNQLADMVGNTDPLFTKRISGPLAKLNKDKLAKLCEDYASELLQIPGMSGSLSPSDLACLWRVMGSIVANQGFMKTMPNAPGKPPSTDAGKIEAKISQLLLEGQTDRPDERLVVASSPDMVLQQACAAEAQQLLIQGRSNEAMQVAIRGQLWGLAMLLGRQQGSEAFAVAASAMVAASFEQGTPLHTVAMMMAGKAESLFQGTNSQEVTGFSTSDQTGPGNSSLAATWRKTLTMLISSRNGQEGPALRTLGDALMTSGSRHVAAAHMCYLLAEELPRAIAPDTRICLLGGDHNSNPRTFTSAPAILCTEVLEWCMAKASGQKDFCLLPLQPYKVVLAAQLIDCGQIQPALHYLEGVSDALTKMGKLPSGLVVCRSHTTSLLERLEGHIEAMKVEVASSRSTVLSGAAKKMDGWLNRLMGGDEVAGQPHTATMRRTSSGSDWTNTSMTGPPAPHGGAPPVPASVVAPWPSSGPSSTGHIGMRASGKPPPSPGKLNPRTKSFSSADGMRSNLDSAQAHAAPTAPSAAPPSSVAPSEKTPAEESDSALQKKPESSGGFSSLMSKVPSIGKLFGSRSSGSKNEGKLGEQSKFYYDEKLKMWREEGVDEIPDLSPPPPPPTSFPAQPATAGASPQVAGPGGTAGLGTAPTGAAPPSSLEGSGDAPAGAPAPLPLGPPPNAFAKRKTGMRSRYVDTFGSNSSSGEAKSSPKPPLAPSRPGFMPPQGGMKPGSFMVPGPAPAASKAATEEQQQGPTNSVAQMPMIPANASNQGGQAVPSPFMPVAPQESKAEADVTVENSSGPANMMQPVATDPGTTPLQDPPNFPPPQQLPRVTSAAANELYTSYSEADMSAAVVNAPPPPTLSPFGGPTTAFSPLGNYDADSMAHSQQDPAFEAQSQNDGAVENHFAANPPAASGDLQDSVVPQDEWGGAGGDDDMTELEL